MPPREPTPDEIAAETAAIRAEWTPDTERLRRAVKNPPAIVLGVAENHEIVSRETREIFNG